ncbi:unnamed protein product, partial [Allacma fusca]
MEIWLAIFGMWVLIIFHIVLFVQVKRRIHDSALQDPSDSAISDEFIFFALGAICQKGFHQSPSSASMQVIFFTGIVAGLLLHVAYSSALVSILSVNVDPVQSFRDLLANEFEIFSDSRVPTATEIVKGLETYGIIKKLDEGKSRNVGIGNTIFKVLKTKMAIVSFSDSFYQVALQRKYQPDFLCQKMSRVLYRRRPAIGSMFVKRGSPLREYFNC